MWNFPLPGQVAGTIFTLNLTGAPDLTSAQASPDQQARTAWQRPRFGITSGLEIPRLPLMASKWGENEAQIDAN